MLVPARSETMNILDARATSVGMCVHTLIYSYEYNALLYTYCIYIYCMGNSKKRLCQDDKINTLSTQYSL